MSTWAAREDGGLSPYLKARCINGCVDREDSFTLWISSDEIVLPIMISNQIYNATQSIDRRLTATGKQKQGQRRRKSTLLHLGLYITYENTCYHGCCKTNDDHRNVRSSHYIYCSYNHDTSIRLFCITYIIYRHLLPQY